jgi:serine/threonine-protein kinase RsbW
MSQQGGAVWTHEVTIPSDTAVGSGLISGLIEAMQERGWEQEHLFRVQLAYEEAIVNAIRHGNECAEDKTVDVRLECDAQQVRIMIEDMGCGFDPNALPDPRSEDRLELPGGRGVMLMRELMTEVNFNERGNRVEMTKHRSDVAVHDEEE